MTVKSTVAARPAETWSVTIGAVLAGVGAALHWSSGTMQVLIAAVGAVALAVTFLKTHGGIVGAVKGIWRGTP